MDDIIGHSNKLIKAIDSQNEYDLMHLCGMANFNDFVNIANQFGQKPLIHAVKKKFTRYVKVLLDAGADVNVTPRGDTAVINACKAADYDCLCLLLQYGPDLNAHRPKCAQCCGRDCADYNLQVGRCPMLKNPTRLRCRR